MIEVMATTGPEPNGGYFMVVGKRSDFQEILEDLHREIGDADLERASVHLIAEFAKWGIK